MMHCIFCKSESNTSRSVEHIIPESLGNRSHTLPIGVVCDGCNNYFATKVEKPFMESDAITLLRFHQSIPSKRGRVPPAMGILAPGFPVLVHRDPRSEFAASIDVPPEAVDRILNQQNGMLIVPTGSELPEGPTVSRFLAKAAIEAMAARLLKAPVGLEYFTRESQLDPIRNHARRGTTRNWQFHSRRIYDANAKWLDEEGETVQLIHEFDILKTDWNEWFFVIAVFGLELVINYGGPEIDGYQRWLSENEHRSPRYSGRNSENWPLRPAG